MTQQAVVDLVRYTLMSAFWLCLPILAVGFLVGVIISLVQIVTSIQDPAFSGVPRLVGFLVAIVVFLPWILERACGFTTQLITGMARYAR
jgi:flagellar biosynthesis protein FliQ